MVIRSYKAGDAPKLAEVFFRSVREAALRDYTPAQVEAWAPSYPDPAEFGARAEDGRTTWVAANSADEPFAYADLELTGHIDHVYCHPVAIGTGVASQLLDHVESAARSMGLPRLFVEASEAARRLFLRKGFKVVERRDFELRSVSIHNYLMEKVLS
ncbi:MAG TPA: GNAT family N-acetyltransferase [Caulobacteraceae bacterium]|jgi:putative acetyltransferase|nr:GNAT family N-acetyltransferase [Caulobacteraceae bacterium]